MHNTRKDDYAIRDGDWLMIAAKSGYVSKRNATWEARHDVPADDDGSVELYNLREDIGQRRNLAQEHPEQVNALRILLEEIRQRGHSAPRLGDK